MATTQKVFILHSEEDEASVEELVQLLKSSGLSSQISTATAHTSEEDLPDDDRPQITDLLTWADALVILISQSLTVDGLLDVEIKKSAADGKAVVGLFVNGAKGGDTPEVLNFCGDAAIAWHHKEKVVQAVKGSIQDWEDPETGKSRLPSQDLRRYSCG